MAWYNAGTLTATNNSATITGAGTLFLANVSVGDGVTIAGSTTIHEVTNVASNTQLSISPVYTGTTGSSKTYSIIPVQGYVRDLANQAKQLILTFSTVGSSVSVGALAGITGAADMIPYFTSGSTMWTTPLTSQARSLLANTTAANMRTTLGLKAAALADITGTVSQSGGVPTGAVIESGTNANGFYIKWADGTMICRQISGSTVTNNAGAGGIYYSNGVGFTYPVTFAGNVPCVSLSALTANGYFCSTAVEGPTTTSGIVSRLTSYIPTATGYVCYIAVGRWY
jgi:hypothetical protein